MPPARPPRPRLIGAGLWLAVTVAATATVWAATSIVAADVTDRPASVLAHRDVVSELAAGPPPADATPTTSTTVPRGGPSGPTAPSRGQGPVPPSPGPPVTTPPPSPAAPPPITVPPVAVPAPVPPAGAPPTTRPAAPPTTRPSQPTATYSTRGGVVRVSCTGLFIQLVSAIPGNGYAVRVVAAGPGNVDVHFLGFGQDVSVRAVCFGQPLRYYDQIPTGQAPGPF